MLSRDEVPFAARTGGGAPPKTVTLDTTTGSSATFNVSDDASWLAVSPSTGTRAALTLSVNPAGLSQGTYTATITASAVGYASGTGTVRLRVLDDLTPDQVHLGWVGEPSTTLNAIWRTWDPDTPSTVEYRASVAGPWHSAAGAKRPSGTSGTLHEVELAGLSPATEYEYRVRGDNSTWSPVFSARTAPPRGPADFDLVYLADTGLIGRADGLATGTRQARDEIARMAPDLVLLGGDYAYYSSDKRFGTLENTIDAWFNQMQPIATSTPMMPTYGNHEVLSGFGESYDAWAQRFATPAGLDGRRYYSFDVGDIHFVSILAVTGQDPLPSAAITWIENDIRAAQQAGARWVIPFMHVSAFSDGSSHPSNLALRAQLGPLFERLGIKIVLTSHDQNWERTYPLVDVPDRNAPTSASTTCYTQADGVTWVKASPAGKLSNKNGDFSKFQTFPPPPYTAFRDDTMHHFARLEVRASGSITVEDIALHGDGSPPIVQDRFEYRLGACPPPLEFTPSTPLTLPNAAPAICKGVPATILGTAGNDVRTGTQGPDVIVDPGGNDTLSGLGGNDLICGGPGKDTLKGGALNDSLLGQKGKDKLKGGEGNDLCKGGKGKDTASKCEVEKSI